LNETALGQFTQWGTARSVGILFGISVWLGMAAVFPRNLLPGPLETGQLALDLAVQGAVWEHMSATLTAIVFAFTGAVILGSALGVFMGTSQLGLNFFTPYVNIGLSVPGLAWAATFFIVFGFDQIAGITEVAPVIAGVLTIGPYLAINIWKGVEGIDRDLMRMAFAFNTSRRRLLRRVILPSVAPQLFAALRFGVAISWKVVTVAEMFAARHGIGYIMMESYQLYKYEEAWAWAATFMILILIMEYGFFRPIEERVFEYRIDADLNRIGK
jgi:NitT/TauT family transport system permease protein